MENAITLILAGILILREWQNWRDRKDLLDRIMCVDYQEYQTLRKPKKTPPAQPVFPGRMTDEEMAIAEADQEKTKNA